MSSFTEAKFIDTGERREGRKVYRLVNDFYYEIGFIGSGLRIYGTAGYKTDLGSVPTLKSPGILAKLVGVLAKLIPQRALDQAKAPFVIHDVLREDERFTLLEGDSIFFMAMEAAGVSPFWRGVFHSAVRTNKNRSKHNEDEIIRGSVRPGFVVTVAR